MRGGRGRGGGGGGGGGGTAAAAWSGGGGVVGPERLVEGGVEYSLHVFGFGCPAEASLHVLCRHESVLRLSYAAVSLYHVPGLRVGGGGGVGGGVTLMSV
jgi:hypothetical protein